MGCDHHSIAAPRRRRRPGGGAAGRQPVEHTDGREDGGLSRASHLHAVRVVTADAAAVIPMVIPQQASDATSA